MPVSEIISVREEEEENGSRQKDDGSWKKMKEQGGRDCRRSFTGDHSHRGPLCVSRFIKGNALYAVQVPL